MKNVIGLITKKVKCLKVDLEWECGIELHETGLKKQKKEKEEKSTLIDECRIAIEILKERPEFNDLTLGLLERIRLLQEDIKQDELYIKEYERMIVYSNERSEKYVSEISRYERAIKLLEENGDTSISSILDKVSAEIEDDTWDIGL